MFNGGIWATTVTPFDDGGNIDEESLRNLIDFYIDSGVHGLSLGILGEVSKLSEFEKNHVVEILVNQTNGRVPISVVCTAQGTAKTSSLAKKAEQLGVQAVMIAPPNNVNDDKIIFKHYQEISNNISVPIIIQDNPSSTGVTLSPTLLAELTKQIKNIEYIKLEDSPTTIKISKVIKETEHLKIIGGTAMFLYEELTRGAIGTMSGFPFPRILVDVFNKFTRGENIAAKEIFFKNMPLMRYDEILPPTVEARAIIKKEIFKMKGVIKTSNVRKPFSSIDERTVNELKNIIRFLDL